MTISSASIIKTRLEYFLVASLYLWERIQRWSLCRSVLYWNPESGCSQCSECPLGSSKSTSLSGLTYWVSAHISRNHYINVHACMLRFVGSKQMVPAELAFTQDDLTEEAWRGGLHGFENQLEAACPRSILLVSKMGINQDFQINWIKYISVEKDWIHTSGSLKFRNENSEENLWLFCMD